MKTDKLPDTIAGALRALESRLFAVLFLFGVGRVLLTLTGLLAGLYALDRLFEPPVAMRWVLLASAIFVLGGVSWRYLGHPLRRRPSQKDLAGIWERAYPQLDDRLATAVELRSAPPGTSQELLEQVRMQAEEAAVELRARAAVPASRSGRSAAAGFAALAGLAVVALLAPTEAGIFLQRILGRNVPWPHDTRLLLLAPLAEGSASPPELIEEDAESYRVAVAKGTVLSLRVRAEGVVPDTVEVEGAGRTRPMRPLGGGEFVLRMAPLDDPMTVRFYGGDDRDGFPRLRLEPGIAPAVVNWSVRVEPPAYTGRAPEESSMNEFRIPQGTRLSATFGADRPGARAFVRLLDGTEEELVADEQGLWQVGAVAQQSGELLVSLQGVEGFRNARAAVLRWQAQPDRAPRIAFELPAETWTTVEGGEIPVLLAASDDFALQRVLLRKDPAEEPMALPLDASAAELRHFEILSTAIFEDGSIEGGANRARLSARAYDGAEPSPQEAKAESAWIEIVPQELYASHLGERMVRSRELVERALSYAQELGADVPPVQPSKVLRRLRRELDSLQLHLERTLVERIYSGMDRRNPNTRRALDAVLAEGAPEAGRIVEALPDAPSRPLEVSGQLFDLARIAYLTRTGAAEELANAVVEGADPKPAARELEAQLRTMLDVLLTWEDFQSAVNLLRGLLDRQQQLYLRTQEAANK